MARVAVLTDRSPHDADWKGPFVWQTVLALAESQHEVLVLTTQNPDNIPIVHPRLRVARPTPSWRADQALKLAQALIPFRPEILHTFALHPNQLWSAFTVWPYLNSVCQILPGLRRFSTLFDSADVTEKEPSLIWHQGSECWSVFSPAQEAWARAIFHGRIDVVPLEIQTHGSESSCEDFAPASDDFILVPGPISEWRRAEESLQALGELLQSHPELRARIAGGWGEWPSFRKRRGWETLNSVAHQVDMLTDIPFADFVDMARRCRFLWTEPLSADSWRSLIAARLADELSLSLRGPQPPVVMGSTANFLSRLYST
ncbi:MAG: hypothetical protein AB7G93_08215 [Bdellovibrionales bacterium]